MKAPHDNTVTIIKAHLSSLVQSPSPKLRKRSSLFLHHALGIKI